MTADFRERFITRFKLKRQPKDVLNRNPPKKELHKKLISFSTCFKSFVTITNSFRHGKEKKYEKH